MTRALNTHFYDNKLSEAKEVLHNDLETTSRIPDEEKINVIYQLKKSLRTVLTRIEMRFLNKLIKEKNKWYDPVNDLHVNDLLYLCYYHVSTGNEDFIDNFRQQLTDLRTGSCVQGRSIRLLQLLYAFRLKRSC